MNIAIAAKGGVGKTIISGTLARTFAAQGNNVLAIDHDSDSHLAVSVGVPRDEVVAPLPSDLVERADPPNGDPGWEVTEPLPEVIEDYGVRAPDGVTLLKARGVEAGNEDFALGHIAVEEALTADDPQWDVVIVDMPAGLEYFGVIKHVDLMLIVVEHAGTALETMETMDLYARKELEMSSVRVVANNVRSATEEAAIEEYCAAHDTDLDIAAVIPHDTAIRRAERKGIAPIDYARDSPGVTAIRELATDIL